MSQEITERSFQVLLAPCLTEKSTRLADRYKQFIFEVAPDATKLEIKQAVETIFEVKVASVSVCWVKGKYRRFKQKLGKRKDWKKAYVGLKQGYDIDFTGLK